MFETVHLILVVSSLLQASALCLAAVLRAIGYLLLLLVSEVDPSQFFLGGPIMRRCCCCSVKTGAVLLGNQKLNFDYTSHIIRIQYNLQYALLILSLSFQGY